MKHYLRIYKTLIKMNFSVLLIYRANFINSLITTLSWGVFQIIFISVLTAKTTLVFGWHRQELIILAVSYVIVVAIFHTLFSRNFDYLSRIINKGELDYFLLKPIDSQFLISLTNFGWAQIFRCLMGIFFMVYFINKFSIHVTLLNVFGFLVLIIFGLALLYSLWLIISTLLIWYPNLDNLVDILYTINGFARYPGEMFREINSFLIFFILPYTFTIATPTKALLNKILAGDVFTLLATCFCLFFISRFFWRFALRFYTSASS